MMMLEHLPLAIAAISIVLTFAFTTRSRLTGSPDVPPDLPWVGLGKVRFGGKWVAKWRARMSAFGNSIMLLEDGYRKVNNYFLNIIPLCFPTH
jgi:hypothetical protein